MLSNAWLADFAVLQAELNWRLCLLHSNNNIFTQWQMKEHCGTSIAAGNETTAKVTDNYL